MKLELVTRRDVSYVELQRDKKHLLGFSITDGTEEDPRPVVKSVKVNCPAAKSFAVAKGDVVLSVNGISTTGKSSKGVRQMLDDAGSNVNIQLLYKTHEARVLGSCVYQKQRMTLRLQKIKGSFGFLLRKCSKYSFMMEYPIISNIIEESPVCKKGSLQDGDRLLSIDNISLSWMSLSYIAALLQAKDVAEFTFEYSIGVVNFAKMDMKIDFEFEVPVADLGITLRVCDKECSVMYIRSIRQGSIAERCGVFTEGDVVLSICDVGTKDLTVSKAYFLLRDKKKCRKISFVASRRENETKDENSHLSSTSDTESFMSGVQQSDWKHLNTPVSSNFMSLGNQQYNFQTYCYNEQIKSMDKFQSILSIMSNLKQALSTLTRQAFGGTQIPLNQNCTSCNNTKHALKLCTSCLARMNVKCAQSMDALRELVTHFIKVSSNMFEENDEQLVNISLKNVIHILRETLPNIFRIPELQEQLSILAEKIASADTSCSVCDKDVKAVMMIAKQLLLVLSISDNSAEFTDLAEHLVCCLLEVRFPCGDSDDHLNTNAAENDNFDDNLSEIVCLGRDEESLSDVTSIHLKNNSETESNQVSIESNLDALNLNPDVAYHDYLKIAHIQSVSESRTSISPKSNCDSKRLGETLIENRTFPKQMVRQISWPSFLSEDLAGVRVKKFFKNLKFPKRWRSMDTIVKFRKSSRNQNLTKNMHQPSCSLDETASTITVKENTHSLTNGETTVMDLAENLNCKNFISNKENKNTHHLLNIKQKASDNTSQLHASSINQIEQNIKVNNIQKRLLQGTVAASTEEIIADSNSESTSLSSRRVANKRKRFPATKTFAETMHITLKNDDGNGFGVGISDKSVNEIPVIDAIELKSPAKIAGVLKLGDRILEINGVITQRLHPNRYSVMKIKALSARTLTLKVEFDVYDEEFKFGSFDVVLDKSLKIGLVFEDMKKGLPMVVKGIAKGSAAHRSGLVFPGDEVTFFKYKKHEVFDPLTSDFNKDENIVLTITRDPKKVLDFDRKMEADLNVPENRVPNTSSVCTDSSCQRTILSVPNIRVPNPSPCTTDPSSSNKDVISVPISVPDIRVPHPSSVYSNPSSYFRFIPNPSLCSTDPSSYQRADINTPDIRVPNPSLCTTDPSLSQRAVINNPGIRVPNPSLCTKDPCSSKRAGITNPDIRVPNPSPLFSNPSTFYKPTLKGTRHPKPSNPSPSSAYPSSCYTNPCFEQDESTKQIHESFELKKTAVRPSYKDCVIVDHEVTLYRDTKKFDLGILLARDDKGRAFIKDIRPDGPADKSGVIKKLDQIIQVNGELVDRDVEYSVLELMSKVDHKVDLLIRRRVHRAKLNEIQTELKRFHK